MKIIYLITGTILIAVMIAKEIPLIGLFVAFGAPLLAMFVLRILMEIFTPKE